MHNVLTRKQIRSRKAYLQSSERKEHRKNPMLLLALNRTKYGRKGTLKRQTVQVKAL